MPGVITHALMGMMIKDGLNHHEQVLLSDEDSFLMGTTGPDIFYYYHVWPWSSKGGLKKGTQLADQFHNINIEAYISAWLDLAYKKQDPCLTAYVAGFLLHFILDTTVHPYIYYKTIGNYKAMSDYEHRHLETQIDSQLYPYFKEHYHKKPYEIVRLSSNKIQRLSHYYQKIIPVVTQETISLSLIEKSFYDCYRLQYLLYDAKGWKKRWCEKIEKKTQRPIQANSLILCLSPHVDSFDVLNQHHHLWKHPITGDEYHTSVFDLFNDALYQGRKIVKQFIEYIQTGQGKQHILHQLDNRSFDTGLSAEDSRPMIYSERRDNA